MKKRKENKTNQCIEQKGVARDNRGTAWLCHKGLARVTRRDKAKRDEGATRNKEAR
jgi:hypothetical protein